MSNGCEKHGRTAQVAEQMYDSSMAAQRNSLVFQKIRATLYCYQLEMITTASSQKFGP